MGYIYNVLIIGMEILKKIENGVTSVTGYSKRI